MMPAFHCRKCFYVPHQDLVVLAGGMISGLVRPGWAIDLPRELQGPGWVPIHDVQSVPFADGKTLLCIVIEYELLTGTPFMEFNALEGLDLDIRKL